MTPLELGRTYRSADGQWTGVLNLFLDAGQQVGRFERPDGLAVYCHASNVLPVEDDAALIVRNAPDGACPLTPQTV